MLLSFRKLGGWLIVAVVVALVVYRLKLSPMPVEVHTLTTGEVRGEVMGTGTLEARVKTTISPRIQERLAEVLVDQGDLVKCGQVLARLDDSETRDQVAIAATLLAARATVERVRSDQARAEAVLRPLARDRSWSSVQPNALLSTTAECTDLRGTYQVLSFGRDSRRSKYKISECMGLAC